METTIMTVIALAVLTTAGVIAVIITKRRRAQK